MLLDHLWSSQQAMTMNPQGLFTITKPTRHSSCKLDKPLHTGGEKREKQLSTLLTTYHCISTPMFCVINTFHCLPSLLFGHGMSISIFKPG
eukprot:c15256_g1_i1 orf=360-632(-)